MGSAKFFYSNFNCDNSVTLGPTQLEQAGSALCVLYTRRFALCVQFRLLFCAEWRYSTVVKTQQFATKRLDNMGIGELALRGSY